MSKLSLSDIADRGEKSYYVARRTITEKEIILYNELISSVQKFYIFSYPEYARQMFPEYFI